eukprot:m.236432 g.236432  ORF g.236432 m.236432 type:complete len:94 (+) comp17098_c2_seq1:1497-1778(+)
MMLSRNKEVMEGREDKVNAGLTLTHGPAHNKTNESTITWPKEMDLQLGLAHHFVNELLVVPMVAFETTQADTAHAQMRQDLDFHLPFHSVDRD